MEDESLAAVREKISKFCGERDWGKFHTPKNLAMAIGSESGELLDTMLWMESKESVNLDEKTKSLVQEELADILIYCFRLCEVLSLDPIEIINKKIKINDEKYPLLESRGNSTKYSRR